MSDKPAHVHPLAAMFNPPLGRRPFICCWPPPPSYGYPFHVFKGARKLHSSATDETQQDRVTALE